MRGGAQRAVVGQLFSRNDLDVKAREREHDFSTPNTVSGRNLKWDFAAAAFLFLRRQ